MKSCIIHFLPALSGDCFVLEFINKECIVIDCGYKTTYKNELKPLLVNLKNKGCKITLLLITHTDQDHIEGAIEFIKENGNSNSPKIIAVDNIWYNGIYNTLSYNPELKNRIHNISLKQEQSTDYHLANILSKLPDTSSDISANSCFSFEQLCIQNGYNLNSCFANHIVRRSYTTYDEKCNAAFQIGACKITVLSPSKEEIIDLSKALHQEMREVLGVNYTIDKESKFIKLCELILENQTEMSNDEENISASSENIENWLGTSKLAEMTEVNKASIVIEIQYGEIKMLFTGDSESSLWSHLLDSQYDIVKLSHHGTTKPNIEMLKHTKGRMALISTNGSKRNQHPEKETIARAILAGYEKLYFNYHHPFKNILDGWQEQFGFKAFYNQNYIEL